MASVWPSPKQTHASSQCFTLVTMSASQVITSSPVPSQRHRASIHLYIQQLTGCAECFFSPPLVLGPQSFPRWETDSKISCEQTLQKGEGPKTSWTREITNDGKLILVKHTNYPPSQSLDFQTTRITPYCRLTSTNYN